MPIKDPAKKREVNRAWRQKMMAQGYGKALYERRKARLDNEERMRGDIEDLLLSVQAAHGKELGWIEDLLKLVLKRSPLVNGKPLSFMPKK